MNIKAALKTNVVIPILTPLHNANAYERRGTFVSTNIKLENGEYIEYPLFNIYIGNMEEYLQGKIPSHEEPHSLSCLDGRVFFGGGGKAARRGTGVRNQRLYHYGRGADVSQALFAHYGGDLPPWNVRGGVEHQRILYYTRNTG